MYCLVFPLFQSVVICHGGRIGFFQGDIRLLPDDMKALRPTIFPVVPRLLNRMYDKVRRRSDQMLWFSVRSHSQRYALSHLFFDFLKSNHSYNLVTICIVKSVNLLEQFLPDLTYKNIFFVWLSDVK